MYSYLITDPKQYSQSLPAFSQKMETVLRAHRPDFTLYRDKENSDYAQFAKVFKDLCDETSTKAMLHGNVMLSSKLKAYGVHLTSQQFGEIKKAKELDLYTVISCHSEEEVLKAKELGADAVTFSPIFSTPDKGEPKGLAELQRMVAKISLPIIALGGITTDEQVEAVEKTGCFGFASIRYFIDN